MTKQELEALATQAKKKRYLKLFSKFALKFCDLIIWVANKLGIYDDGSTAWKDYSSWKTNVEFLKVKLYS